MMKLCVKVLQGQEVSLEVDKACTVGDLKLKILQLTDIPIENQRLVFKGKPLQDASSLESNSIISDCKLMLTIKKLGDNSNSTSVPAGVNSTGRKPGLQASFWDEVMKILRRHFMEEDAKTLLSKMKQNFSTQLSSLSLDDIERLARSNLDGLEATPT